MVMLFGGMETRLVFLSKRRLTIVPYLSKTPLHWDTNQKWLKKEPQFIINLNPEDLGYKDYKTINKDNIYIQVFWFLGFINIKKLNLQNDKDINLKQIDDSHDGTSSIAEAEDQIPFKIKEYITFMILKFQIKKRISCSQRITASNICSIGSLYIDIR